MTWNKMEFNEISYIQKQQKQNNFRAKVAAKSAAKLHHGFKSWSTDYLYNACPALQSVQFKDWPVAKLTLHRTTDKGKAMESW